jgi:hypothetical protein
MLENNYVPFPKAKGKFGIKNKSSKYKKNKLKYTFKDKDEAERFIVFLNEREAMKSPKKNRSENGIFGHNPAPIKMFLELGFFDLQRKV